MNAQLDHPSLPPVKLKNRSTRRASQKAPVSRQPSTKLVKAPTVRAINRWLSLIAGAFLPIGGYTVMHYEVFSNGVWDFTRLPLVVGALICSLPTMALWAYGWCRDWFKAIGFTIMLEGIMVWSQIDWLALSALAILVAVNGWAAYNKAMMDAFSREAKDANCEA